MKDTIKNQNTASTSKENTEWCTIKEAHEISGYSTTKIREWVDNGFIKSIKEDESKREYLVELYKLSDYRETTICAPNPEILNNIVKELTDKGYVLNE